MEEETPFSVTQPTAAGEEGQAEVVVPSETLRNLLSRYIRQPPDSVVQNIKTFTLCMIIMFTPVIVFMYIF